MMGKSQENQIAGFIGKQIRNARLSKQISQAKLGELMGLTYQQIQKYENGHSKISAVNLFHLAEILGVSVSFFYPEKPSQLVKEFSPDYLSPENIQEQQLLEMHRNIPDSQIRAHFRAIGTALASRKPKKNPKIKKKKA